MRSTDPRATQLVVLCLLALSVGGCTTTRPSIPSSSLSPHASATRYFIQPIGPRCTLIPPNAGCAASVSRQVGFPIAWLPTPPGWKATNGITTVFQKPIADEYLVRDDLVLEVQSGAAKHEPPGGTREFSWQGARVVMWAGEPQDGADGAALPWLVRCTWSRAKHPYEVDVFPRPDVVSTLRLQDGVAATRLVFQTLAYAPSG